MSISRKPPKNRQFKKGQSGNPRGRPKKPPRPVSRAHLFRKVANEMVNIEVGGEKVTRTIWEAFARKVHHQALNKEPGFAQLFHQMRKKFPGAALPGDKYIWVGTDDDMKL
jgi:Family of unknown function (DUF5681)